jgi:hypothetical protein
VLAGWADGCLIKQMDAGRIVRLLHVGWIRGWMTHGRTHG